MTASELRDPFERIIAAEPGWAAIAESGFLDALVPEEADGAGLTMAEAGPLIEALGYHACPLPVAETMVARALLARAGRPAPEGPIALSTSAQPSPHAAYAEFVLSGADLILAPPGATYADNALRPIAAVLAASQIAGAAERILEMSVAYAAERVQFGRPIAKQQAIQQQLAVMAEQVLMARLASQIGWAGGLYPTSEKAAVAKQATSAAAPKMTAIAHAVHGAIGVTAEFPLQRFVKLLYSLRLAHGSESYWAGLLGRARMAKANEFSLDFVRTI